MRSKTSPISSPWRKPWQTRQGRMVYDNPWITVYHEDVITPGGQEGLYGVVSFKNHAVAVVPVDSEGYTYLVGQYRYPLNAWSWEVPEGGCPVGTDPVKTAHRELEEETGLTSSKITPLGICHLSNSVTDESGYFYLAEDLTQGDAQPEHTEDLVIERVPFSQAIDMVHEGHITDSMSVIALMRVERLLDSRHRHHTTPKTDSDSLSVD